jgi:hypothetical protein
VPWLPAEDHGADQAADARARRYAGAGSREAPQVPQVPGVARTPSTYARHTIGNSATAPIRTGQSNSCRNLGRDREGFGFGRGVQPLQEFRQAAIVSESRRL